MVVVEGWAALRSSDVEGVLVTVDGEVRAPAELHLPTPRDHSGRALTAWSDSAGWRVGLDRGSVGVGRHRIGAVVLLGNGLVETLEPTELEIAAIGHVGSIDSPIDGATVVGNLLVCGWFLTGRGYDQVEVSVGGGTAARARILSSIRPDVAAVADDPDAPLAGWDLLVSIGPGGPADVSVVVDAVGPRGRLRLGERFIHRTPRDGTVSEPERAHRLEARTALIAARHRADADGLNLLVVTHDLGLGGGQLYLEELLRHVLRGTDVICTVLSMTDGVLRDELEALGARVLVVGAPPTTAVRYEQWLHQLAAVASTSGANVVLANTAGAYWGIDLAARLGVPSVWAIHESFTPEAYLEVGFVVPPDDLVERRFLEAFGQAGAVVFEADATKRLFEHLIRPGRAVRMDYGIDLDRVRLFVAERPREGIRARLGIDADQTVLICIGTFEPRKAQGLLVAAFARVVEEHPRAILALVGDSENPFSSGVHAMVERFGLAGQVRLIPVTPDIEDWYRAADAFVLASDVESLPRSMLEAMAFGTPVLAASVFGVPEIIEDGVNGILLEPSSVGSAAEALERVLRMSPAERQELGDAGRQTVMANRSSLLYAQHYRALFSALRSGDDPDRAKTLEAP
jgi:D-inositol-3-phosphate glycosyltransferase